MSGFSPGTYKPTESVPAVVVVGGLSTGTVRFAPHLCKASFEPRGWYSMTEINAVLGVHGMRAKLLRVGVLEILRADVTVDGVTYYRFAEDYTVDNWFALASLRGLLDKKK